MPTEHNIGPGAIGDARRGNGPPVRLADPNWIAVQTYVADALALPTTDAAFAAALGPGAPSDL